MKKFIAIGITLFYLFVIQILLAGYLRWDTRLYLLWAINFVIFFVLGLVFYHMKMLGKTMHRSKKSIIKQVFLWFKKFCKQFLFVFTLILLSLASLNRAIIWWDFISIWWFVGAFALVFLCSWSDVFRRRVSLGRKLFLPKDILFLGSLIIALNVFFVVNIASILLSVKIFFATLVGFLFFVLWVWVIRALGAYSVWKLVTTRLYILILVLSFLFVGPQFYFSLSKDVLVKDSQQWWSFARENIQSNYDMVQSKLFGIPVQTGNFLEIGTWEVLGVSIASGFSLSWYNVNVSDRTDIETETGIKIDSGFIYAWTWSLVASWDLSVALSKDESTGFLSRFEVFEEDDFLPYNEVIAYLIESENVITAGKDLSFDYVEKTSTYYKYFKAAKHRGLIGTNAKPNAFVKCDNYLVMKWLLQWWDINGYQWDIFQKYFQKAQDMGQLNGCKQREFMKKANL